jgi:carbon starvation protein
VIVIDIEHRLILHWVSLFGAALSLVIGIYIRGWQATLLGGLVGFVIMFSLYFLGIMFVRFINRRRMRTPEGEALGFGDVILGGVLGLLIWRPGMGDFPAFTTFNVAGLGPLWPILFVTIACGAISGWHSLVSSSGTARQLEKETDALYVGGGSMFLEMFFAIIAFLTATVAFGGFQGYVDAGGGAAPAKVFSVGLATFMNQWGLPMELGTVYGAVFLTLMALTIMYLVVRFMRAASSEALGDKMPAMKNVHVGTTIALIVTLALIWLVPFLQIWVMFGAANQLMASLALLLVTLWLKNKGKNYQWTLWPFIFMFITTIAALLYKAYEAFFLNLPKAADAANPTQYTIAQVIIGVVALVLIVTALILALDAYKAFRQPAPKPVKANV